MGFIISLIFLCIFLITAVYIYYKERTDDIFTATEENAKIDKGKILKKDGKIIQVGIKWKISREHRKVFSISAEN